MKRLSFVILLLVSGFFSIFGYQPPNGGEELSDLRSPALMGTGSHVTSTDAPQSGTVNPAATGLNQRITLDLSYTGLIGLSELDGDTKGWQGHGFNLGGTFPTKFGVFSGTLNFLHSSGLSGMQTGTFVQLGTSFAKDLFPDFLVGAGLNFMFGGADKLDWGLSLDLGVLRFAGDYSFMKDLRWGIVLQGLGKWYDPYNYDPNNNNDGLDYSGFPSPFTPVGGIAFSLLKSKDFDIEVQSDVSLPSFQNFRWNVGSSIMFRDFINVDLGLRLDARQLIAGNSRGFAPSFGFGFTFKTDLKEKDGFIADHGWNRSEVIPRMAITPLQKKVWAFGLGVNVPLGVIDTNAPQIAVEYNDGSYISPNHDGKVDDLVFPIIIKDERLVSGFRFRISGPDGNIVREILNKDERPENAGFKNIVDRLVAVKSGIHIPETLRWDGITDGGTSAPDGEYSFSLEAWDDNNNSASTQTYKVNVDTVAPQITIQPVKKDDLIFSPNGDGNKDIITIVQTGSKENIWSAAIIDAQGTAVRSYEWKSAAPQTLIWDGKDDAGNPVPDGVYAYTISSTDAAENSSTAVIDNIILSTEQTPIHLTINTSYFSPNRDNVLDEVIFTPEIPVKTGIETWELVIKDENGVVQRTYSDTGLAPKTISFDGKGDRGNTLPEGKYVGTFRTIYRNGNKPEDTSPGFTLDLTPPNAMVRTDTDVFSPNGDGNKDTVTIFQETSREDVWYGSIVDNRGASVKTFTWFENAESSIVWNGHTDSGTIAPDGSYTYLIKSTDRAGNNGFSQKITFTLNTEETPVFLSVDTEAFSPNADGKKDRIRIMPQLRVAGGIASYETGILNSDGVKVRAFTGKGAPDTSLTWDGLSDTGKRLPDGQYSVEITIFYENGNKPSARTGSFVLDTEFPKADIVSDYRLFSPDGDGKKDTLTIRQTTSQEELWHGSILSATGTVVRTYFWKGKAPVLAWDGTDEAGNPVDDGIYRYNITSTDKAGNSFDTFIDQIVVDKRPAKVFITADTTAFSPNGDGFAENVTFTPYVSLKEGIETWKLLILNASGAVVRQFGGSGQVPAQIKWDGKTSGGTVQEGLFHALFNLSYEKGNEPSSETTAFALDITPPRIRTTVSPRPFSPDNDGIDDELRIGINVQDASEIREWKLSILDPKEKVFHAFGGKNAPGDIIWDGRSVNGELVQAAEDYPYVLTVTDILGNSSTEKGIIPVDVLVIRDGDKLKIRISSINFAANSPDLMSDAGEAEKNLRILKRLTEILNKYNRYKIRIEGHAVRVYWNDPVKGAKEETEELEPLSKARAETVKAQLVSLGVEPARISTAGLGGKEPVVDHSDAENRWKNRRVEFILIR